METVKFNIELTYDPAILILGIHLRELQRLGYLYTQTHCSIIHNSQEVETTQTSTGVWIKEVLYLHVMEYYSAFKRNDIVIHATTCTKLEDIQFSSVQFSRSVVSDSLQPHESQHARPPCPSPTPGVHSNSRPSSRWCHPAISSSVVPFSSCPQSLPASESFPMSQLFAWGGQSIGVSASASVLPMNTQDWSPLGWTGWISLQSKGLPRVFSNTSVQNHQFFSTQLSSQFNSHLHTWLLENHSLD